MSVHMAISPHHEDHHVVERRAVDHGSRSAPLAGGRGVGHERLDPAGGPPDPAQGQTRQPGEEAPVAFDDPPAVAQLVLRKGEDDLPITDEGELAERTRRAVVSAVAAHLDRDYDVTAMRVPSFEAYERFRQAKDLWYLDWGAVIDHLQGALALDPELSALRTWLAMAFSFSGEHQKAEAQLAEVAKHGSHLTPFEQAELRRVTAHVRGHLEETLAAAREQERLAPEVSWARYNRACYAFLVNRPAEAVAAYAALGETSHWGSQWAALDLHAQGCHTLGRYDDELELGRRGLERYPGFLHFLEAQAAALAALGRLDGLERVLDRATAVQAQSGTAGLVMLVGAMELRVHGQHERSVELARRAADWYQNQPKEGAGVLLTPNRGIEWYRSRSPDIALRLGEEHAAALYWAERWDEAERIDAALASENPGNVEYLGQLGAMAARRGDRDEARRADETLRSAAGSYVFGEHTFWRACIVAQLGERQKAVDLLREAFSQGRWFTTHIHRHIDLEPLWEYGPFQELIAPRG